MISYTIASCLGFRIGDRQDSWAISGLWRWSLAVAGALALTVSPVSAAESEALLKQAAQHFADLEDEKAKAVLLDLSKQGNADADVLLGYLYSDPLYAERDYATAIAHFERAAASNHPEAVFQLAESSFWSGYLDRRPGSPHNIFAGPDEATYALLQRAVALKHGAARLRLALLCVYQGYDCDDDEVGAAYSYGLGLNRLGLMGADAPSHVTDALYILNLWRTEPESFERSSKAINRYRIGLSYLNPLVTSLYGSGWRYVTSPDRCPGLHDPGPVMRMFSLLNGVAERYERSLTLDECYKDDELEILEEKLLGMVDGFVTQYGTASSAHISWCYENFEWEDAKACLVTATFDQNYSCFRLSFKTYIAKHGVEYLNSERYSRCRAHMLAAQER